MSEGSSKLPANENPVADPDSDPESDPMEKKGIRREYSFLSGLISIIEKTREEKGLNDEVRDSVEENLEVDEVSMEEDEVSMEEDEVEEDFDRSTNADLAAVKFFTAEAEFEELERIRSFLQNDGEDDYDDDDAESKFNENYGEEIDKLSKNSNFEELMVELNPKKLSDPQFNYEKLSVNKDDAFTSRCVHQFENPNPVEQEIILKNILIVLKKNREILWSRICSMEDELALQEETFERLSRGAGVGLDLIPCTKYFVTCDINDLMPKNEKNIQDKGHGEDHSKSHCEQQTRLHGTFFHEKSSCEDLKDQCLRNGWRLPRYIVEPSNGRFLSTVFVSSQCINLTSKGDLGASPSEARESAAAKIINEIQKIQNTFARSKLAQNGIESILYI